MSINIAIVGGNLGRPPELRTGNSGTSICTLSVATTHRTGEDRADETTWHRVVCFGHTADACAKYLQQGDYVVAHGRRTERKWTDKHGAERTTSEIIAERVDFGSRKSDGGAPARSSAPRTTRRDEQPPAPPTTSPGAFDDDDIPF